MSQLRDLFKSDGSDLSCSCHSSQGMSPALVAAAHSPESISRVDLLPGGDQPITMLLVLGSGANTCSPLSFRAHGCNIFVAFLFYNGAWATYRTVLQETQEADEFPKAGFCRKRSRFCSMCTRGLPHSVSQRVLYLVIGTDMQQNGNKAI